MTVLITCTLFKSRVNRNINTFAVIVLSAFVVISISFKFKNVFKLLRNKDFSFQFHIIFTVDLDAENEVMTHVLNADIAVMHVRNVIDQTVQLSKHIKLNKIIDFEEKDCYHLNASNAHLITKINWKKWTFNIAIAELIITISCFNFEVNQFKILVKTSIDSFTSIEVKFKFTITLFTALIELITIENIIIYNILIIQQRLLATIDAFSIIWKKNNTINVSKFEWMFINIIFDVKSNTFKVYFVNSQNREIIDKKFDKLHRNDKLKWITDVTSYDFSMFVVWRMIHILKSSVKKNWIVINIREFNKIIVSDDYFMSLQTDITNLMNKCLYVNVINETSYFHQWSMKIIDRYKLIVMLHRDNEQWNVTLINFRNSSVYIQR